MLVMEYFMSNSVFFMSVSVHFVCLREFVMCARDSCFMLVMEYFKSNRERERNVLFNDALNTFYQWLYGVRHIVKDHSDSEKGNPHPPHRLLLSINSKGSFICTIPQTG